MRQQFIFCVIVLLFIACNNSASTEQKTVDSAVAAQTDTVMAIDVEQPLADPFALTAAEIKDDSVFADSSIPTSWENAGFADPLAVKSFVKKIQYWVANNQKDSVAAVIAYPLRKPAVKNVESFLKNYDSLVDEKVRKALREQNLSQIFRNAKGAMISNGELWINKTSKGLKIVAINN